MKLALTSSFERPIPEGSKYPSLMSFWNVSTESATSWLFHVSVPAKIASSVEAPALFSMIDSRYSVTHHVSLPAHPKGTIFFALRSVVLWPTMTHFVPFYLRNA